MKHVYLHVEVYSHQGEVRFSDEEWAEMVEDGTLEDELWTLADEFAAQNSGGYYEIED